MNEENIENNLQDLAAALNGHQLTDEHGDIVGEEETSNEESATHEENSTEDTTEAEKPIEESDESTQDFEESEEDQHVDEQTVPYERFAEVYGELKKTQRELGQRQEQESLEEYPSFEEYIPSQQGLDKATALENELLYQTMPEFNPQSERYSKEMDSIAGSIYISYGGQITKLEAARRAKAQIGSLLNKQTSVRERAKTVKRAETEAPVVKTRSSTRRARTPEVNPDQMSVAEKEAWLRENGMWDSF